MTDQQMQQQQQPVMMQQPGMVQQQPMATNTVVVVQAGGNQKYYERDITCCCCCPVPCGFYVLAVINVLNLYQLYNAFWFYNYLAAFDRGEFATLALIFLIVIIISWLPVFVFFFHIIKTFMSDKQMEIRSNFEKAAKMLIIGYLIQGIAWPIFLLIIAGTAGLILGAIPFIEFMILACFACWWKSSASKYKEEQRRLEESQQ